jgi:hypothetical protein
MYITSRVDLCRFLPPILILAPDLVSYRVATYPIGSRFFPIVSCQGFEAAGVQNYRTLLSRPLWWLRRSGARHGDQLLQECWLPHLPPIQQEHDGKTWGCRVVHIRETTPVSSSVEINPGFAAGVGFNADLIHR